MPKLDAALAPVSHSGPAAGAPLPAYALAADALTLWAGFWNAWFDAAGRMMLAGGASDWLELMSRAGCANLTICEHAVADRLAANGVTAPLLNDA